MPTKPLVTAILLRMDRIQKMYKAAAEDVSLPANLAVGTGAGVVGGLGSALHSQLPALREMKKLKDQMPHLMKMREQLQEQVINPLREGGLPGGDRQIAKQLLRSPGLPANLQAEFTKRYKQGYPGLSRASKTLRALKGQLIGSVLKRGLLGAGLGTGAGLLAATGKGYFDKETDDA